MEHYGWETVEPVRWVYDVSTTNGKGPIRWITYRPFLFDGGREEKERCLLIVSISPQLTLRPIPWLHHTIHQTMMSKDMV